MRVIDLLDRGAMLHPAGICLRAESDDAQNQFNFRETVELSHRIASALLSAGVEPRAPVAVLSPNDPLGYTCMMGLWRAGCAWLPVNGRNPLHENRSLLTARQANWLFYHSAYAEQAAELRATVPTLRGTVCIDRADTPAPSLRDWMALEGCTRVDIPGGPEDLCAIVSTGGTTGEPRGAMLPNRSFETMSATYMIAMPMDQRPVHLVVAPMTHGAGASTLPMLALGAVQIFMAKPDPGAILEAIEQHRVTHVFMPPTLIYMLLAHPDVRRYDYSSLRYFLYAAAPMSVEKLREAIDVFGPVMAQSFGQVEAPMICTYLSPADHVQALRSRPERLLSCGRPTPLTRVAIMNDDGQLLPPGQRGEIVVQGSLVMTGYHGDPKASEHSRLHGWHHTGDIGAMDEDGFVYVVDRKRDLIISGGFNIYPGEVEQVLLAHPAVQDGAVIGVPDEKWGEAVKAVVELKPGASVGIEALDAWCRERLGGTKSPKSIEIWPELPRSAVGKVLKKSIRAPYWAGKTRAI